MRRLEFWTENVLQSNYYTCLTFYYYCCILYVALEELTDSTVFKCKLQFIFISEEDQYMLKLSFASRCINNAGNYNNLLLIIQCLTKVNKYKY